MIDEARKVMGWCRRGVNNKAEGNDLAAECYGTIGMLVAEVERLQKESARPEEDAIALLRLWYKMLEYSDPHGDAPRVAEVLRRYPISSRPHSQEKP